MLALVTVTDESEALDGQVWVCGACGRHGKNREQFSDVSCITWAVLCYERASEDEPWKAVHRYTP